MHSTLWPQAQRRTLEEQARCIQLQVLVCNTRFVPRLAPAMYSSTGVDALPGTGGMHSHFQPCNLPGIPHRLGPGCDVRILFFISKHTSAPDQRDAAVSNHHITTKIPKEPFTCGLHLLRQYGRLCVGSCVWKKQGTTADADSFPSPTTRERLRPFCTGKLPLASTAV